MTIGKVIGTVVCTQKSVSLEGASLKLVQPLSPTELTAVGNPLVAVDAVGAGRHELVLLAAGSSARQTAVTTNTPCDAVIMAIVDNVEVHGNEVFRKGEGEV